MMDVFNISTTTEAEASRKWNEEESFWLQTCFLVKIITIITSVLGLLGNFLSYKSANFMTKSNSSVLMKYLAVWDSAALVHLAVIPGILDTLDANVIDKNVRQFCNCPNSDQFCN